MKTQFQLLSFLTLLLFGCETKRLFDDSTIAEEIIAEVNGSSGNIYFTEDKMAKNDSKKFFVELNVNRSEMIHKHNTERYLVASYCAAQLYKRLDQATIEKNYGFNIIFDNEEDMLNPKKYFFEKSELKQAIKAFDNIDKYLSFISTGDFLNASSLIDTSYFFLNVNELNRSVKNKIDQQIIRAFHFYKHFEYENKAGTKKTPCFAIGTIITRKDSSQTTIEFLTPIYEASNKIINLDTHEK